MLSWPGLRKAKNMAREISLTLENLEKEHNSLTKKEIALHSGNLSETTSDALTAIEVSCAEMLENLKSHKSQLEAKSRFLKRHNENGFV